MLSRTHGHGMPFVTLDKHYIDVLYRSYALEHKTQREKKIREKSNFELNIVLVVHNDVYRIVDSLCRTFIAFFMHVHRPPLPISNVANVKSEKCKDIVNMRRTQLLKTLKFK